MFCKSTLIALALALVSAAAPAHEHVGISIPVQKRNSLTKSDGTFDRLGAIKHNAKIANKYRQNLINFQRNTGGLPDGIAAIPPLATYPGELLAKRQKVPLTGLDSDSEWAGNVTIGTPATTFVIDFDTGSADLWVPSSSCSSCGSKPKYDSSKSSTSSEETGTFEIEYADGTGASGPIFTDTVTVGGIKATNQFFGAVTSEAAELAEDSIDGILGLAFPSISNLRQDPFFNTAIAQKTVKQPIFAFKLASSGSELYLGGTNTAHYSGAIEYHKLSSSVGYWQIGNASALVGGKSVVSGFQTIIDSGTTIMYGPPASVETFYKSVEGSAVFDAQNGLYSFPCDPVPNVAFSWGGKSWSISAANFNLGETETGSGQCVGALAGLDLGLGDNVWLLGDSFMKNVYTVFSVTNEEVGFAELK